MCRVIKNWIEGWLLWREMKKIASSDPFFAIKGNMLTRREAEALLRRRDVPSGKEVVRKIRTELNIPE